MTPWFVSMPALLEEVRRVADERLETLHSSAAGLTTVDAERRLAAFGPNEPVHADKGKLLALFLGNFTHSVLPVTDKFMLRGKVRKNDEVWNVDVSKARIGESDLSGRFRYDPRPERPSLTGTLLGSRLYISDLFPAFGLPTAR